MGTDGREGTSSLLGRSLFLGRGTYLEPESQITNKIKWQFPIREEKDPRKVGMSFWKWFWQKAVSSLCTRTQVEICIYSPEFCSLMFIILILQDKKETLTMRDSLES